MTRILVAADDGLRTFDEHGSAGPVHHAGRAVNVLAPDREDLWAIVEQTEVWHAPAGGDWVHVGDLEGHAGTCIAVTDGPLVGTSDARLFRVTDDAVVPVESFDSVD